VRAVVVVVVDAATFVDAVIPFPAAATAAAGSSLEIAAVAVVVAFSASSAAAVTTPAVLTVVIHFYVATAPAVRTVVIHPYVATAAATATAAVPAVFAAAPAGELIIVCKLVFRIMTRVCYVAFKPVATTFQRLFTVMVVSVASTRFVVVSSLLPRHVLAVGVIS